jgi:dolichyl-phosphate-mannose-protein mannosyltransferase
MDSHENIRPMASTWRAVFWPAHGKAALAMLLATSFFLHFWHLGAPARVAFDESLVGMFSHAYLSGQYVFDIHPPHMKLFYAGLGKIFGMPAHVQPFVLNEPYSGAFYLAMRAAPALAGTLVPWVVFGLARQLGCRRAWALVAACLALFDSALTTSSQLILNDIPLLFCGLAGLWSFGLWRSGGPKTALPLAALLLAAALGVKWTALVFFAPMGAILCWDACKGSAQRSLRAAALVACIVLVHHAVGYGLHFSLLDKPGPGMAFMTPQCQAEFAAQGPPTWSQPARMARWTLELNRSMARFASQVPSHPYGSSWSAWPFGRKAIYVWTDKSVVAPSRMYAQPNLAAWWLGTLGAFSLTLGLLIKGLGWVARRRHQPIAPQEALLVFSWACGWLPFAAIGRVMFVYHYYPALIASFLCCAWMCQRMQTPRAVAALIVATCAGMFLWLAPWTYGLPLPEASHQAREAFGALR